MSGTGKEQSVGIPPAEQASGARLTTLRILLSNEFGLLVLIVLFAIIFSTISPAFLSKFSLYALGRTSAVNIMIGFSMMVVIITGGLNLSVGSIGVCAAMFGGLLMQAFAMPWPLAVCGGLAMGAALGALNGFIIVRSGLHSFIITLATMSIFFGVMIFLTRAESYRDISPAFTSFGRMKLAGPCCWSRLSPAFCFQFCFDTLPSAGKCWQPGPMNAQQNCRESGSIGSLPIAICYPAFLPAWPG